MRRRIGRVAEVLVAVSGLAWLFAGLTALLAVAVVSFVVAATAGVPGGIGFLWYYADSWFADPRTRLVAGTALAGIGAFALGMAHLAWLEGIGPRSSTPPPTAPSR